MLKEEELLKILYENNIAGDKLQEKEELIRKYFPEDDEYQRFISDYLEQNTSLAINDFIKPGQKIDAFMHTRYIIQEQHTHDFLELKFMLHGSCMVYMGENAFFMKEGDVCFIAPYTPHSSAIFDSDSSLLNVVITIEHINDVLSKAVGLQGDLSEFLKVCMKKTDNSIKYFYFDLAIDHKTELLLREILEYYMDRTADFSDLGLLRTESSLETIVLNIADKGMKQTERNFSDNTNRTLKKIMLYIEENMSEACISELSKHLKLSESYTSRFIKKNTGRNFNELLKVVKLKKAAELLRTTEFTVDEIMNQIGSSGKTNFYNNFKKHYHMTPSEYRHKQ